MWPGKTHFLGDGQTLWQTLATFCSKCHRALQVQKQRGRERMGGGKKDFIYVETNIREEVFDVLVLGQVPILSVYLSEMTSLNVRE